MFTQNNTEDDKQNNEFAEKTNTFLSNSKKLTGKRFICLKKIIEDFIQRTDDQQIAIPDFEIGNDFIEIELPPGVFELVDINNAIKQTKWIWLRIG